MSARFAMRDCDHCEQQVLATADGRCPRCDAALSGPTAPQLHRVTLSPAVDQPHLCLQCGAPTHRLTRVRARGPRPMVQPRETAKAPWWVLLVTGNLGCLFWLIQGLGGLVGDALAARRPGVSFRVRQCAECGLAGRPPANSPDFDARRITFEAHPRFIEALARVGRQASATRATRAAPPRGDDGAKPVSPS